MTVFLMGIAAFVGLQHLGIWLGRREDRVNLWMIGLSLGTLVYLVGFHMQMSSSVPLTAIRGARLQWTGGNILVVVLLGLITRFVGHRPPRGLIAGATAFAAGHIGLTWLTDTVIRNEASLRVTIIGERYWGAGRGPMTSAFVAFMLVCVVYGIVLIARARGLHRLEQRIVLVALVVYLLVGVNEVLCALLVTTMRLFPPAFALIAVAFNVLLARRFEALADENERLLSSTRAQAQSLERKNGELDSFVYSVSHDLKSPLVSIEGMAGILREDYAERLDDDGQHLLQRIQANVRRMERLISDLLLLSRVGREGRDAGPVSVPGVVDGVLDELRETIRARGVDVKRDDDVTVWANPTQLEQVFRNLISNAVKFLGPAPHPTVEIAASDRGSVIECSVHDNGIGIDPTHHEKVFEIFQRLNEVETDGTGVGLALVRKIVESNGGRVWIDSAAGQGATFRFTWPKAPADALEPARAVPPAYSLART